MKKLIQHADTANRVGQDEALAAVIRISRRGKHLPNQLTDKAVSQLPAVAGSQLPSMAGSEQAGKPTLSVFLPRGKPYRYLSSNAIKVHLYLLRRHQRKVPPHSLGEQWTLYGETTIARIANSVGMKDRTIYRALDELVDFGLARREKRRSKGVIIGLAYWLLLAPKELTDAAIQRLKAGLINAELATEEAKRKLSRDGVVFDSGEADRKAQAHALFRLNGDGPKDHQDLPVDDEPSGDDQTPHK